MPDILAPLVVLIPLLVILAKRARSTILGQQQKGMTIAIGMVTLLLPARMPWEGAS